MCLNLRMKETRLQLHLDVHKPIELVDLTLSFQALAFEYKKYMVSKHKSASNKASNEQDVKLYITKIEHNCILAEFATGYDVLGQAFTAMSAGVVFGDFVTYVKTAINYFKSIGIKGSVKKDDIKYTKQQSKRFADLLDVVAKNKGGRLGINTLDYEDGKAEICLKVDFTSEEAYQAKQGAIIVAKALEETTEADYKGVSMYFYQTNIDEPKVSGKTGDKAVIESISSKPLPVYFISELDHQKINYTLQDPDNNPLKATMLVDVNIEKSRTGKPFFYRVINVHQISFEED